MIQNTEEGNINDQSTHSRLMDLTTTDSQLRALIPSEIVQNAISRPGLSDDGIIAAVLAGYADRPAFGARAYKILRDPATGQCIRRYLSEFSTISYGELRRRVEALANAWRHHRRYRVEKDDFVCIVGFTGIDFAIVDLACTYARAVVVPLQIHLATADIGKILTDTNPAALVATMEDLEATVSLALANGRIRNLVAMDFDANDASDRIRFDGVQEMIKQSGSLMMLVALNELLTFGSAFSWTPFPEHELGEERLAALIHTSGSTGTPKGAMLPERMTKFLWTRRSEETAPEIVLAYTPMNHLHGRYTVYGTIANGGTVYFTSKSDMSNLFEELRLVQPTTILFIPRLAQLIYQHYQSEVARRADQEEVDLELVRTQVCQELKETLLGNRLQSAGGTSAPTPIEIQKFLRDCFGIKFSDSYGSTETLVVSSQDHINRANVIDYYLCDVPEAGYYKTDKPFPRGELIVKTKRQILGYFKNSEATAALFDGDGYIRSGDIFEERGPDHIVWVGRKNDVLKLAQGEYVAVGPLETAFETGSALVKQIYVYGNSLRAYLLAVVVPDMDVAASLLGRVPEDREVYDLVRAALQETSRSERLRSFEVPREIIVESEPFSFENGLLSSIRKGLRPSLKRKYGERLEALYIEIDRRQQNELLNLKRGGSEMTILEKIGKALGASLGLVTVDLSQPQSFTALGGDSLAAVSFSQLLEEIFGVSISVNTILSPAGNTHAWTQSIERALGGGARWETPSFAQIHGEETRVVRADALVPSAFLNRYRLNPVSPPGADAAHTVLLTGASGYLGRFLCLDWMERLAPRGGKVICLIRAVDDAAARRRLQAAFDGSDIILSAHFNALAVRHLEVLAADISEPLLGLDPPIYDRLASEVDQIVHAAALVNHILPYQHLFGPNVVGTAELIGLALARRQKRFDFVSSIAVANIVADFGGESEDADLPKYMGLCGDYASGYSVSKWAGEVLLRHAHDMFQLPVHIFRADMVLAHRRYKGQINVLDMFTRLLYSIIVSGLAPHSFYDLEPNGHQAKAHYDGLPADFVADTMTGIGCRPYEGFTTYNIVNTHYDDGISLDRIVDWIVSAGYSVERMAQHDRWFECFSAKLGTLPENQRQHSSHAILEAFREPISVDLPRIPTQHFEAALSDFLSDQEVPKLSEAFIHKCLDDLRRLDLIPHGQDISGFKTPKHIASDT